jgi:hypothetical protein
MNSGFSDGTRRKAIVSVGHDNGKSHISGRRRWSARISHWRRRKTCSASGCTRYASHFRSSIPPFHLGMAVFPKGPDGCFIFPSKDGRPVAPVTVYGVPVVPLDEQGKAIVPYDNEGNAMIHVGADGVTPLTDEEYAQQLQWHQYYEQYNQYAAQYYQSHQPPPIQQQQPQHQVRVSFQISTLFIQHDQFQHGAGYGSSNATYEGWQGIRATKKIRPEDIDLPIVPQNNHPYGEMPPGMMPPGMMPPGMMPPGMIPPGMMPFPTSGVGSTLPPPTMTEQQRQQVNNGSFSLLNIFLTFRTQRRRNCSKCN